LNYQPPTTNYPLSIINYQLLIVNYEMTIMSKDFDIIYYTLFPWDNPYYSVSLAFSKELAKRHRVFYINRPYTAKDFMRVRHTPLGKERAPYILKGNIRYEKVAGMPENFIAVQPPVVLPINFLPEGILYDTAHAVNTRILRKAMEQVIKDNNIKEYAIVNCYDPYFTKAIPRTVPPKVYVYQCIDDLSQESYTAKHGVRLEHEAMQNVHVTTVTGRELYRIKQPFAKQIHYIPNAVDIGVFERAVTEKFDRPSEIAHVKGKIIGFTGNMDDTRINYELLKNTALAHPDKTLVLVGPINSPKFVELGLDKMPNIIATGSKKVDLLPAYLQHFDCAVIPFLCNTLTKSIYPIKINEYLASGKPVIATNFSEDIRTFSDSISLAMSDEDFIRKIDTTIADISPERIQHRIAVAHQNTWAARAVALEGVMQPFFG
jgi:glycosyltransferase involved in cell wall biosynthesis